MKSNKRHPVEYVRRCVEDRGYRWVGGEYVSNRRHLTLVCPAGHERVVNFTSFMIHGCRRCSYLARTKPEPKEDRARAAVARHKARLRARVDALKVGPCVDCGVTYESFAMEFDHVRGKTMPVSAMVSRHMPIERIREEVRKTDLVCVLCHRTRTYRRSLEAVRSESPQAIRRREGLAFIWSQKRGKSCRDCARSFEPWQMDYDHRPGTRKRYGVSKMTNMARQTILAEMDKCDLVCVVCHRRRTHARGEATPKIWRAEGA